MPPSSYINLKKWAESDAEFVRSLSSDGFSTKTKSENRTWWAQSPAVVDSYSCRQLYLRSYTFSKKETMPEKTIKCFGKFKRKAIDRFLYEISDSSGKEYERKMILKKKKKKSSVFFFIFHKLLSCNACFDAADLRGGGAMVHAL